MRTRRTGSIAGTDISAVFEDDDIAEQFSVDGSLDFSVQEPLTSKATVTEEHPSLVHERMFHWCRFNSFCFIISCLLFGFFMLPFFPSLYA